MEVSEKGKVRATLFAINVIENALKMLGIKQSACFRVAELTHGLYEHG